MNQDEHTHATDTATDAAKGGDTGGGKPPSGRSKKSLGAIGLICGIVFVALYAIVNISVFASIFSKVMSVLTPIILGFALAYALNPILKLFEFKVFKKIKNKNLLRSLSLLATYLTAFAVLTAFLFLVIPQLVDSVMGFVKDFDTHLANTADNINRFLSNLMDKRTEIVDEEAILAAVQGLLSKSGDLFDTVMDYVVQYGMGLIISIKNIVLAIFISIYVLAAKERLKAQVLKITTALFTHKGKRRFYRYVRLCHRTFGGFFLGKIIDSLIIGVITLVVLLLFRMPYALLVSTIVCITNIIPIFGPIIGAIPSFFIIFIVSPSKALIFLILILLIQQLDGNVIGPKILGNTTGISTLGVIVSIIIMGDFFGVIGMLVGVPIFAFAVALGKELIDTKLKKKSLSADTADYYAADSLVDPHEEHESVSARIFKNIGDTFCKMFRIGAYRKTKAKKEKPTQTEDTEDKQ